MLNIHPWMPLIQMKTLKIKMHANLLKICGQLGNTKGQAHVFNIYESNNGHDIKIHKHLTI